MNTIYIHERECWTDFSWDATALTSIMEQVYRETGFLAGRLDAIGFDEQILTATDTLTSDIVESSAIEGIMLDTTEVRSSVARKLGIKISNAKSSTHYVDGIVEMMLDATANYNKEFTEERLFSWHSTLFPTGRSGLSEIHVGAYRTEGMQVVSGMFGHEKVHYRAPAPERVPKEMQTFLSWINAESTNSPYIQSAIAHLWFVSIHPFDDGNGRIARAISDMMLAKTEKNGQRFYSVSAEINKEKGTYYHILEKTQHGNGDITEWLKWYLTCILNAVKLSNANLSSVLRKSMFWHTHSQISISERQKLVLNTYLDGYEAKFTRKNYAKLAKISTDTAGRDINELEAQNVIRKEQGRVRDASYSLIYSKDRPSYSHLELEEKSDGTYLVASLPGSHTVSEKVSAIDQLRVEQEEITLSDLADKYLSFLKL